MFRLAARILMLGPVWLSGLLGVLVISALPVGAAESGADDHLIVLSLPGLIEVGENDSDVDWVTAFEGSTGCRIDILTETDSKAIEKRLGREAIDLLLIPADWGEAYRAMGLTTDIAIDQIQRFELIDPGLIRLSFRPKAGMIAGIPLHWAPWQIMYDRNQYPSPPQNLTDLYHVAPNRVARPSVWGRAQALGFAAMALADTSPELGIDDPYALTEIQYKAALNLIRRQFDAGIVEWTNSDQQLGHFLLRQTDMGLTWPLQVETMKAKGRPFGGLIPSGHKPGWRDGIFITAKSAHQTCAYRYINYLLSEKVNGDLAAWYGSIPAIPSTCASHPKLGESLCRERGSALASEVIFQRAPDAACADSGRKDCVSSARWQADFLNLHRD
jgi:putative spermidine/putrescine transport system substrate-binding protein